MARPVSTEGSKAYVGMLIITCLAMALGIAVMVLEGMEYDWVSKPPAGPVVQLPTDAPPAVAPAGNTQAVPVPTPVAVEAPKPFVPPAVVPVEAPKPAPAVVAETPKPADTKPVEVTPPSGPIPSPLVFPGR